MIYIFIRAQDVKTELNDEYSSNNVVFDNSTGKFIVPVKLSPLEYSKFIQDQTIANLDDLVFEQKTGQFKVKLIMSLDEYGCYLQDQTLPSRLKYFLVSDSIIFLLVKKR